MIMAVYRFLFAPVLLAVAVLTGAGDRPRPAPPPLVEIGAAEPRAGIPAPAADVPAGTGSTQDRRAAR
jgi:hypothetical protein